MMARLDFVRNKKNTDLLLLGINEEGERSSYTVSRREYEGLGSPQAGSFISDGALFTFKYLDEEYRARKKALSLLSFADNNERSLKQKLQRFGIRREIADKIALEMVELGYIDEQRQLRRLITDDANIKLYGAGKIILRLQARGYSHSKIKTELSRLVSEGEIDFKENARKLLKKRLPADSTADERKKLLYKYGYKIC